MSCWVGSGRIARIEAIGDICHDFQRSWRIQPDKGFARQTEIWEGVGGG